MVEMAHVARCPKTQENRFTEEDLFRALEKPDEDICGTALVPQTLRARMRTETGKACTDQDLIRAALRPDEPLIASRLPRLQTWRFADASPESFQFSEDGLTADLFTVQERWMKGFMPRSLEQREESHEAIAPARQ